MNPIPDQGRAYERSRNRHPRSRVRQPEERTLGDEAASSIGTSHGRGGTNLAILNRIHLQRRTGHADCTGNYWLQEFAEKLGVPGWHHGSHRS